MSIAYGIDIKESEDPYISVAEEAVSQISQAGVPGTFLDRLFSDPQVCTRLVSRRRFSKDSY